MNDDLSILGVIPSDRKKLENMGITKLAQIATMSVTSLGMGNSKGNMLIQRARNILAKRIFSPEQGNLSGKYMERILNFSDTPKIFNLHTYK